MPLRVCYKKDLDEMSSHQIFTHAVRIQDTNPSSAYGLQKLYAFLKKVTIKTDKSFCSQMNLEHKIKQLQIAVPSAIVQNCTDCNMNR